MFVAPWLIAAHGWQMVPKVYAAALVVTAAIFQAFSASDPARAVVGADVVVVAVPPGAVAAHGAA